MTSLEVAVAIAIAIGMAGILVPALPGSVLILGAVGVWAFHTGGGTAWAVLAGSGAFVVVGTVVKYLVPGRRLKAAGVPTSTLLVGGCAGVAGFFVIPIVGLVIGFVTGVYFAETRRLGRSAAWPSTKTAIRAVGTSIAVEMVAALLAAATWAFGVAVT
ncbi:MAG: DUF456 domain-containing protein [Nocardioides sp.]